MKVAARVPTSTMPRLGRSMNNAGSLAAKSMTTASSPMLATMPIRVEGFIETPLKGPVQKARDLSSRP